MPCLDGFSNNPFRTRNDVVTATKALVQALQPYFSAGKARVKVPVATGAHFDEEAAQLEGFARPIWAIAAAVSESSNGEDPTLKRYAEDLTTGISNGVNSAHPEYWGSVGDWDQRMVEAEPLSFALLLAPSSFYAPLSASSRTNLMTWLSGLNGKVMPENNWRWFRIFSNLALHRVCGVPYEEVNESINKDFALLDQFELGEGWTADGFWRKDSVPGQEAYGRHADYYSGSFAIHFSQLLYCTIAGQSDPDRVARYLREAREFSTQFWRYFDKNGAAIPFGRSLTYRFAMGAFYAAFAFARAYDNSSVYTSPGFVKGMLLRHLRWWASNSQDMFAVDGTLTIGYLYPNMFMCESYNSPQSPYWAMKSFVMLVLGADDVFWEADEIPHPMSCAPGRELEVSGTQLLRIPSQILCDHPKSQHHFLLSSGQFCVWPMKATQAKYSKFAYSSAFGFSVPTGDLLAQLAPDSTLVISRDGGDTWATRWVTVGSPCVKILSFNNRRIECLQSVWKPWKASGVEVETTLIPPAEEWPDWHVRVHRIRNPQRNPHSPEKLCVVEGGFAIAANQKRVLPDNWGKQSVDGRVQDGIIESCNSALAISDTGASGIRSLLPSQRPLKGKILKADPNTNLIQARTAIPTVHGEFEVESGQVVIVTAAFAIGSGKKRFGCEELRERWSQQPQLTEDDLGI